MVERARGARQGLVAALVPVLMAVGCAVPGFLPSGEATRARTVILISGDGMGPAHIEAARRDSTAGLELDRLELRGRMVTGPPDDPDEKVTDSAAAATAWSTGSRTSNGSVGVDADGESVTFSSGSSGGPVTIRPRNSSRSSSRPADESWRAASMCAGPIPSPLMRITLRARGLPADGRNPGTAHPTATSTAANAATDAPRARSTAAPFVRIRERA